MANILSWGRPTRRHVLAIISMTFGLLSVHAFAGVDAESQFVFNSISYLLWGALVMWMCAGFTMLEAGSVRTKNASVICLKNIGLFSIAALMYYIIGYNLMYTNVDGWIGSFTFFYGSSDAEIALLNGQDVAASVVEQGNSTMSDWFFQMVFVATTASIISGTLAERVRMWSFFLFIMILTAFIYPVVGAWTWGGGWLSSYGFQDFAGSTIVHSTGGWAALVGAIMIGPRLGKFRPDGSIRNTPPSNVPIVTLGVFILWLGWFGFNGGSQLALGTAADVVAMSNVITNTAIAGAAGFLAAIAIAKPVLGRVDLLAGLNGAIAGLVSVTAGPNFIDHYWAILIGAIGGMLCILAIKGLEIRKVDDVVGAVSAHLVAGVWGTLAVCITTGGDFVIQVVGILAVGMFVSVCSIILWVAIEKTIGLRVTSSVEHMGQDTAELGIEAYPEFVLMPEEDIVKELSGDSDD